MNDLNNNKENKSVICTVLLIVQYVLVVLAYCFFMCSCGHSLINKVPVAIFLIIQYIVYRYLKKKNSEYKLLFIIISMILLVIVAIFTRNDMDELHRIEAYDMMDNSITNSITNPVSTKGVRLYK